MTADFFALDRDYFSNAMAWVNGLITNFKCIHLCRIRVCALNCRAEDKRTVGSDPSGAKHARCCAARSRRGFAPVLELTDVGKRNIFWATLVGLIAGFSLENQGRDSDPRIRNGVLTSSLLKPTVR